MVCPATRASRRNRAPSAVCRRRSQNTRCANLIGRTRRRLFFILRNRFSLALIRWLAKPSDRSGLSTRRLQDALWRP